jgi:Icc-related predicted phosphoesterase
MKVKLLSDCHTEFWKKQEVKPGSGEVLILAGDIGLVADLGTKDGLVYQQFLEICSQSYDRVFYVLGNHEHYHYDINQTADTLRSYLPPNITLLDDSSEFYNGVHFVGGTLWADFMSENAMVMWDCQRIMSDYHIIMNGDRNLTPSDTLTRHKDSCEWMDRCLDSLRGPVVMVTHHAPHLKSLHGRYTSSETAGAYHSNMEWMMERYPDIVTWCHGHVHESNNYNVFGCNVISNPFGYHPNATNEGFRTAYEFEVPDKASLSQGT